MSRPKAELKCVFASGYLSHGVTQAAAIDEGMHFLQTPFSTRELAVKVRPALESRTIWTLRRSRGKYAERDPA